MYYINCGFVVSYVLMKMFIVIYCDFISVFMNKLFCFVLGMGLLEDGYFGSQNFFIYLDVWYDEFFVIIDKSFVNYGKLVNFDQVVI